MDEPSKPKPSSNASTLRRWNGTDVCCHFPIRSTNFRSTMTAECFLPRSIACLGSIRSLLFGSEPTTSPKPTSGIWPPSWAAGSQAYPQTKLDRFFGALARTDTYGFVHRHHENLSVADATGLRALLDGVD